ncbi:hypothetical protein LEN26_018484 [Aphanomyces euteiches]|nr:hypothetical protein LEN26_018484 [Aphanomyces euteiches]KAH9127620.1 hypothetical protein AeMF1_002110 [Aphanomyces euteiches]KAH9185167.1 hypothetical protein AeNC1_012852 [Aphanomyces euteiches]
MTDRAAGDETLWDIQADLHFLLEDSQDAIEDLDVVWDVVTTTEDESPEEAKEMRRSSPRNKRKSHEARLRDTKAGLLEEIQVLQGVPGAVKHKTLQHHSTTRWEKLPRRLRSQLQKALNDRQNLQAAIHANKVFISKMTTLVRKKPKVHPALSLHTSGSVLPAEPTLRRAAIHAIGDNLFRLKGMTFVVAGVLDQMDNSIRVRHVVDLSQRTLMHEITSNMTLPAPSHVVGKAMWQVYNGEQKSSVPATAQVVHERLDDDTVYERFKDKRDGAVCHANSVMKHFVDGEMHTVVARSVPDDQLLGEKADNNPMEDHKCWITVEPMDKDSCRLTFVMQILFRANTTPSGRSLLEEMAKSARNLTMESKLPDGGIFSVPMHLPQCVRVLPLYDTLVERCNIIR